jgi:hypothetical protein
MNNYKISTKVFLYVKLKLRASEIPKYGFHGSYNLNPVDLQNREGGYKPCFSSSSEGCGAVLGQTYLPAFRLVYNVTQAK